MRRKSSTFLFVFLAGYCRVLAEVAYLADHLVSGLCVYSLGRQSPYRAGACAEQRGVQAGNRGAQYFYYFLAVGVLARSKLDLLGGANTQGFSAVIITTQKHLSALSFGERKRNFLGVFLLRVGNEFLTSW